jgi:hypothetical protein
MDWMDEEDQPIWVVYQIKNREAFALQATTKDVWETMIRKSLVQLIQPQVELIAEGLTYETANKMIGLTKG